MTTMQGQDGTPFLSYYDKAHALSFVWDGMADAAHTRWIDVSFGGYGEPVIARIPWETTASLWAADLNVFATTCQDFINQIHAIEDVDDQAHGRTQP